MAALNQDRLRLERLWKRYSDNFSRHIIGVSRHTQASVMAALARRPGYSDLRTAFEPYISMVGSEGLRVSELASALSISKQLCIHNLNNVEKAGYLKRVADPLDSRARLIRLTPRGLRLVRDSIQELARISRSYGVFTDRPGLEEFGSLLAELHGKLGLPREGVAMHDSLLSDRSARFGVYLARISEEVQGRLMRYTIARGHEGLKISHGQVLGLVGLSGGRIQTMARINGVSRQAVSRVAEELEALGYIRRVRDPADARGRIVLFTPRGVQVLEDSVMATTALEDEFRSLLGAGALARLSRTARDLYLGLGLEREVFDAAPGAPVLIAADSAPSPGASAAGRPSRAQLLIYFACLLDAGTNEAGATLLRKAADGAPEMFSDAGLAKLRNAAADVVTIEHQLGRLLGQRGAGKLEAIMRNLSERLS